MFDLEREIAKWRCELESVLFSAEAVDELEAHLREEIDRQLLAGGSESQALAVAVHQLGDVSNLQREFERGDETWLAGVRRTFSRIRSGYVRSRDLNAFAFTAAILGVLGLAYMAYYSVFLWELWQRGEERALQFLWRPVAMAFICALAVRSSWVYVRRHEVAAARGLVGFNLFFVWLVVGTLSERMLLGGVLLSGDLLRLSCRLGALFILLGLWWLWMRRLARITSTRRSP